MNKKGPGPVERRKMAQKTDSISNARMSKARASANWKDSVSRVQAQNRSQMIRERLNNPPNYTDSLAVHRRNLGIGPKLYDPIAEAAEKKYGKMNVSGFKESIYKRPDLAGARKKYGLK